MNTARTSMRNLLTTAASLFVLLAAAPASSAEMALDLSEPAKPAPTATPAPAASPASTEPAAPPDATASPAPAADAAPAAGTEKPAEATQSGRGAFLAGVKVGGFLTYTALRGNARVTAEVGYVLPWLNESFAIVAEVGYAEPRNFGTQSDDPRVEGGSYHWHLVEQQLTVMPTVFYRLTLFKSVVPYLGVGARIYMLKSTTRGDVRGVEVLATQEQSTQVGIGIPLGVQIHLGPGHLTVELLTEWGPLDHTATGQSNTGAESLQVGYRFLL